MADISSAIRTRLLGIDPIEVEFEHRGFARHDLRAVERLEGVGRSFVEGYMLGLEDPEPGSLAATLDRIEAERRGFAYEGAAMALTVLDLVTPWRRDRLARFVAGPGDPHVYMVLIGAGWAWARLRRRVERLMRPLDPVLGWLALDGYGFHEAYFHPHETVEAQRRPARLRGYARRAFDTGVGRSLWFVCGADPDGLARCIGRFDAGRWADLWSGAGLACSYAGGVDDDAIEAVARHAGPHRAALAQGAAFAAKARLRAGIPAEHTRRAVERICRTSVDVAAKTCDVELARVPGDAPRSGAEPGFELWRRGIQQTLARGLEIDGPDPGAGPASVREEAR